MASTRLEAVIAEIDDANACDPRQDAVGDLRRPRELVYAERMSACLARLYPDASDELRIAARAQHLCRWQIPRSDFPVGRDGYNAWRTRCREHHATLVADILRRHHYDEAGVAHIQRIIRKENLKRDPDSQALENVAAVVFVEHYFADFVDAHPDYDADKLAAIIRKTLRKMDATGHAAALAVPLPERMRRILEVASRPAS